MRSSASVAVAPEAPPENRPYHHGDLRRALVTAALNIVEREGLGALSLRAVAREAGVSPAAPYHHFKDKQDLMFAVGALGFERLSVDMQAARDNAPTPLAALSAIGVAYVCFARKHPSLYTLMWDCSRHEAGTPEPDEEKRAYAMLEQTIIEAGVASPDDPVRLKLAAVSAWTKAHGLAEMAAFEQFAPLKEALGGEEAFFDAVISFHGEPGTCP
jgi:AcrR family transcriptional regulator